MYQNAIDLIREQYYNNGSCLLLMAHSENVILAAIHTWILGQKRFATSHSFGHRMKLLIDFLDER